MDVFFNSHLFAFFIIFFSVTGMPFIGNITNAFGVSASSPLSLGLGNETIENGKVLTEPLSL